MLNLKRGEGMKKVLIRVFAVFLNVLFLCVAASTGVGKVESSSVQDLLIKSEVETAVSMLQAIYKKHQKAEMSLEEAKRLGADLLRELRYGKEGYFWADTTEGINVVLYGKKDVEGKSRLDHKDRNGIFYIRKFLALAKAGGGYTEYWFSKRGELTPQPKRSGALLSKPFGCVVCSGYYR